MVSGHHGLSWSVVRLEDWSRGLWAFYYAFVSIDESHTQKVGQKAGLYGTMPSNLNEITRRNVLLITTFLRTKDMHHINLFLFVLGDTVADDKSLMTA